MSSLADHLRQLLGDLRQQELERELSLSGGVDFSSNDYLGLAKLDRFHQSIAEKLAGAPHGSPASRLLAGNLECHGDLEEKLACFKGTESSLLFSTGYQANIGVLTSLVSSNDRVISDEFNHASIIDGLRLTRAQKDIVPHLDIGEIEKRLRSTWTHGRTFLVTESLFSMDGDIAPLDRYADLCEEYGAELLVDDAHATGVYGEERGSGLAEHFGVERRAAAITSTFGKALGFFGAFVSGSRDLTRVLINRARAFIFTTAPPPVVVAGMQTALELLAENSERRTRVIQLADRLRLVLRDSGINTLASVGPIVPVVLGENHRALTVAENLRSEGFDVRAIRPPSVRTGTARLRICVHADHAESEIDRLAASILRAATGTKLSVR